jgi:predicted nucleic acid-binding protein
VIVIDASLAVKWYLAEPWADEAEAMLAEHLGEISTPDIFLSEVVGALVRQANINKPRRRDIQGSITRFIALFENGGLVAVRSEPEKIAQASQLALDLGHPLKDCIYLALAMELGCELVTCDARFAAKAKGVWAGVRVLGE